MVPAKEKGGDKKELLKKATIPAFEEGMGDETIDEAQVSKATVFVNDDFDTSRKELEEGYLDDEEEEDDTDDGDLYAADETESFESYDEEDFDYDDEEEYGAGDFGAGATKKKKFEDDYEEEEE